MAPCHLPRFSDVGRSKKKEEETFYPSSIACTPAGIERKNVTRPNIRKFSGAEKRVFQLNSSVMSSTIRQFFFPCRLLWPTICEENRVMQPKTCAPSADVKKGAIKTLGVAAGRSISVVWAWLPEQIWMFTILVVFYLIVAFSEKAKYGAVSGLLVQLVRR